MQKWIIVNIYEQIFYIRENLANSAWNSNCFYALNNQKTDLYGIHSLSYFGLIGLNMIPNEIRTSTSFHQFKNIQVFFI